MPAELPSLVIIHLMLPEPERFVLRWPEHDIEMAFRLIPPGEFGMGSRGTYTDEEPCHLVRITEGFWLGETPVTQSEFAVWTRAKRTEHENAFPGNSDHPAENMTWCDAICYCEWVERTMREKLPDGFPLVCLPTEAEWEYACRAGTQTEYYTGEGEEALAEAGWYGEKWGEGSTHPVRRKVANAFRLYDMHGNVWEWCHDLWDEFAYSRRWEGVRDPGLRERNDEWGREMDTMLRDIRLRVLRGGSWYDWAFNCRSAVRYRYGPDDQNRVNGLRLCLARGPAAGRVAANRRVGWADDRGLCGIFR